MTFSMHNQLIDIFQAMASILGDASGGFGDNDALYCVCMYEIVAKLNVVVDLRPPVSEVFLNHEVVVF